MNTETIRWQPADTLPDADMLVLICCADGVVDAGFLDGNNTWRLCESGGEAPSVKWWADMPEGPRT